MTALSMADARAWESWLADHHDTETEVWLKIAKKGATATSVTIGEALDVVLCWGWIDGHRRALDDEHYLQRYSPRRKKSPWSKINVAKANALIKAGRMQEAGQAAIDTAKADDRWTASQ